jgi:hypothetical protein
MPAPRRVATSSATNPTADSKAFLAGETPPPVAAVAPEPPVLDAEVVEAPETPIPQAAPQGEVPRVPPAPPTPPQRPPAPPQAPNPFGTLLWSHTVEGSNRSLRAMQVLGRGVIFKSAWSTLGGFVAEAMCFVPDCTIKDGKVVADAEKV